MRQEGSQPGSKFPLASSDRPLVLPGPTPSPPRYDDPPSPLFASLRLTLAHAREIAAGQGVWNCTRQAWGLSIRTEQRDGAIRLVLTGDLDHASAPLVEQSVALAQDGHARVIVDLDHLDFLDSSGVEVFLHAAKRAESTGGRLQIINSRQHRRVFTLCRAGFLLEGPESLRPGSLPDPALESSRSTVDRASGRGPSMQA